MGLDWMRYEVIGTLQWSVLWRRGFFTWYLSRQLRRIPRAEEAIMLRFVYQSIIEITNAALEANPQLHIDTSVRMPSHAEPCSVVLHLCLALHLHLDHISALACSV